MFALFNKQTNMFNNTAPNCFKIKLNSKTEEITTCM